MNSIQEVVAAAKADGGYQPIDFEGKRYVPGWRSCDDRWEAIKPHIPSNTVTIDIGSHHGFFGRAIASDPTNIVLSVESLAKRIQIQKCMNALCGLKNIAVCNTTLDTKMLMRLAKTIEQIDTILALGVIHYFDLDNLSDVVWLFSKIAPRLIIEIPSPLEAKVPNKEKIPPVDQMVKLLQSTYETVVKIGEALSPDPDIKRPLYCCTTEEFHKDGYSRMDNIYWRHHRVSMNTKDNKWHSKNKEWITAVNVYTLFRLGVVDPSPENLFAITASEYHNIIHNVQPYATDKSIYNALFTPDGIKIIDYDEATNRERIEGRTRENHRKRNESLSVTQLQNDLIEKHKKSPEFVYGEAPAPTCQF